MFRLLRLSQIIVFVVSLTATISAGAFGFIISESQINNMLSLTFPYQTRMGAHLVTLSDPQPHFYATSQEIGISLNVSLNEANQPEAKARATLRGGIHFDNTQQQLQLVKPKIASLEWVKKPAGNQQGAMQQVTQLVGQELPVIVLLDIKQFTGGAIAPTLRDITVKPNGIEISM